ncbi:hypothetical protein BKA63DRAFT_539167 [Paraphoma chrysanthemicola]|nr:hypothetical protein BKA63DRAFT_539167 [Paraphoma chrysanthemicola]
MAFQQLVRFEHDGKISYGELLQTTSTGYNVKELSGSPFTSLATTENTHSVSKLLCPLESTPIILCIGLNYKKHAEEANLTPPPYPVVFVKPADALAGPHDDIPIHPDTQSHLDYEGELCVIIGRDAKNVSEESALDYVLGYCIGNDVSARNFQLPDVSGGQFCYAKSFDKFAPIGPAIWSTALVPDPQKLVYETRLGAEVVQKTGTEDMIWTVRQIIAHLSRGTTLRKGTVIMAGTPSGVGFFRKRFLKDGEVVSVEVEGLGGIANKMVFERK